MKRDRDEDVSEAESMDDMADTLMLLSKIEEDQHRQKRVFACKTCNKEFSSFQALGGHRASHKKPRIDLLSGKPVQGFGGDLDVVVKKTKTHECSICGQEFPIGQALGGHMRRHRGQIGVGAEPQRMPSAAPVMKKTLSSNKRVLSLDLNLSPLENDLRLMLGNIARHSVNFVI